MSPSALRSTAWKPTRRGQRAILMVPALFVVLLFTAPALTIPADPPQHLGDDEGAAYAFAAERGLFGRFQPIDGRVVGSFLDLNVGEEGSTLHQIRYQGEPLIDHFDPGNGLPPARILGSTLVAENQTSALTVHDNRYAWISYRGVTSAVDLRFPVGSEVAATVDGVRAIVGNHTVRLIYEEDDDSAVTMDGPAVRIEPETGHIAFTITLEPGPLRTDLQVGGWFLVAHTPHGTVVDALHPERIDTYALNVTNERVQLHLPPLGPDDGDAAYRVETIGVFPTGAHPRVLVQGPDGRFFQRTPPEEVFLTNGTSRAFSAAIDPEIDGTRILLRQGVLVNGTVAIVYEPVAPRILHVTIDNLTVDWQLREEVPELVARVDKASTGMLNLTVTDTITLTTTTPAHVLRFPLTELEPETDYVWTLIVTDRAGNTNRTSGTLTTPLDPFGLVPQVTIHDPHNGQNFPPGAPVWLNATIDDGSGRPLPAANIEIRHNDRPINVPVDDTTRYSLRLGLIEDGRHVIEIRALGYDRVHVAHEEVRFTVAIGLGLPAPALGLVLFAVVTWVAVQRRRGPLP